LKLSPKVWAEAALAKMLAPSAKPKTNDLGMSFPPSNRNKLHGHPSDWNRQNGLQPAKPGLAQSDVAAVDAGDVAGNGEAEPG